MEGILSTICNTKTTSSTIEPMPDNRNVQDNNYSNQGIPKNLHKSELLTYMTELKWFNIIFITVLHGVFIREVFRFPWIENFDLVLYNFLLGAFIANGISAGIHRLWTHRSYKAKLQLRIFWMICYCFAGIIPMSDWIRDHRVHHKFTDTDADPYNAKRGFFFSHVGWLFVKKHPEVIRKGKKIDMSDILADPVIQFHQKYYIPLTLILGFILPTIIPPLCWGKSWYWSFISTCIGRYVVELNLIWSINSFAHKWGNKPYNKYITPIDNFRLSLFTLGEGWHNYHHAFPWAYKFGRFTGYYADSASLWIDLFSKIGWAYDLKTPSLELIRKVFEKDGDGSHPVWGPHMDIPENALQESFHKNKDSNRKKLLNFFDKLNI